MEERVTIRGRACRSQLADKTMHALEIKGIRGVMKLELQMEKVDGLKRDVVAEVGGEKTTLKLLPQIPWL